MPEQPTAAAGASADDIQKIACNVMLQVVEQDMVRDCKQHAVDETLLARNIQDLKFELMNLQSEKTRIEEGSDISRRRAQAERHEAADI